MSDTYRDPCPKCGARLVAMSKEEYVEHLRENGETLAAKIEEEMVVSEDCADANPDDSGEVCADATGVQMGDCPGCDQRTKHHVETTVGDNGTVSRKACDGCGQEWDERYVRTESDRSGGGDER